LLLTRSYIFHTHVPINIYARGSDEQLNKFAAKFHQKIEANQDDNHFAWLMGVELYNIFEGRKEVPSLRILER
jgi:hypothetical protein